MRRRRRNRRRALGRCHGLGRTRGDRRAARRRASSTVQARRLLRPKPFARRRGRDAVPSCRRLATERSVPRTRRTSGRLAERSPGPSTSSNPAAVTPSQDRSTMLPRSSNRRRASSRCSAQNGRRSTRRRSRPSRRPRSVRRSRCPHSGQPRGRSGPRVAVHHATTLDGIDVEAHVVDRRHGCGIGPVLPTVERLEHHVAPDPGKPEAEVR
jgi:hypothetical protein